MALILVMIVYWFPVSVASMMPQDLTQYSGIFKDLAIVAGIAVALHQIAVAERNARVANKNAVAAIHQADVAHRSQLSEEYSKAIQLLGQQGTMAPLGGIYALEGIALEPFSSKSSDSYGGDDPSAKTYLPTVVAVLSAYLRKHATERNARDVDQWPTDEIKAALKVLGAFSRYLPTHGVEKIDLRGCHLKGLELEKRDLSGARLNGVNLDDSRLSNLALCGCDLRDLAARGARTYELNMTGATLENAKFSDAHLTALTAVDATDLIEVDLRRARLWGANLEKVKIRGGNLENADLRQANLQEAEIRCWNLEGVNFQSANLRGSSFGRASMMKTDLTGAQLHDADLSQVRNLSRDQLVSAEGNEKTKIPEYLEDRPESWFPPERSPRIRPADFTAMMPIYPPPSKGYWAELKGWFRDTVGLA